MHRTRAGWLLPVTLTSVVLTAGCGPLADPSRAIGFQLLGYDRGLRGAAESHILASTSLADLRALLAADHHVLIPGSPNDGSYGAAALAAWPGITAPDASLVVALARQSTAGGCANADLESVKPVSYTHLTLPTICSV